jgi:heme-degrading monooxygenase HmoA
MFARLVTAQIRIDKKAEVVRIWKWNDIPLMKSVKGYRGAYLLTDPKTCKGISLTLWDSEEDAIADERSAQHRKQVDMYKGLFAGKLAQQRYEVSAQDKI